MNAQQVVDHAKHNFYAGDLEYARKLVTRVQGGDYSAQTPIQQQAFTLRGWIDASIIQPRSKEEVSLLKESIRQAAAALPFIRHIVLLQASLGGWEYAHSRGLGEGEGGKRAGGGVRLLASSSLLGLAFYQCGLEIAGGKWGLA